MTLADTVRRRFVGGGHTHNTTQPLYSVDIDRLFSSALTFFELSFLTGSSPLSSAIIHYSQSGILCLLFTSSRILNYRLQCPLAVNGYSVVVVLLVPLGIRALSLSNNCTHDMMSVHTEKREFGGLGTV